MVTTYSKITDFSLTTQILHMPLYTLNLLNDSVSGTYKNFHNVWKKLEGWGYGSEDAPLDKINGPVTLFEAKIYKKNEGSHYLHHCLNVYGGGGEGEGAYVNTYLQLQFLK